MVQQDFTSKVEELLLLYYPWNYHVLFFYLFNEDFERLGVVHMNLGIDVEVKVALLVRADLDGGRPGRVFRHRLPVQDLDRAVPFRDVIPLGKLVHVLVVILVPGVYDEVNLKDEKYELVTKPVCFIRDGL